MRGSRVDLSATQQERCSLKMTAFSGSGIGEV